MTKLPWLHFTEFSPSSTIAPRDTCFGRESNPGSPASNILLAKGHVRHTLTIYWPMILMCPCIIDFIGANGLRGRGGGGPGHSWALKWHERSERHLCPVLTHSISCLDSSLGRVPACTQATRVRSPAEANLMFVPSLPVRWQAPTTHSISCLDSSVGRVPACNACDPGSIPGGSKLHVCLQDHNQHYAPVPPPPHPTTGA
jgi:hypothetical protein